jgi:hypothetical protein
MWDISKSVLLWTSLELNLCTPKFAMRLTGIALSRLSLFASELLIISFATSTRLCAFTFGFGGSFVAFDVRIISVRSFGRDFNFE